MKKEFINGIFGVGLSLYTQKTLVIADIHMGYEEAVNKQGILIPRRQYKDTIALLEQTFAELKVCKMPVEKVIINGDLKHEFGTISETEWRNTLGILDFLSEHCRSIDLIKGNHDTILGPIAGKRNVAVKHFEVIGDIFVCHGDYAPDKAELKKAKTLIIGHEHPSVSLRQGGRTENERRIRVNWDRRRRPGVAAGNCTGVVGTGGADPRAGTDFVGVAAFRESGGGCDHFVRDGGLRPDRHGGAGAATADRRVPGHDVFLSRNVRPAR